MTHCTKAVLIGSSGMLGQDLLDACRHLNGAQLVTYPDRGALNLAEPAGVTETLRRERPGIIINAAGYTNVDGAETHTDEADQVNRGGPAALAAAARELDALLVHFSTDYVFNGRSLRAYRPDDQVDPINQYGLTKFGGEAAIRESGCRHLIIRTSWLFAAHGRNFVKTILKLAATRSSIDVVNDQRGRPTYCRDLAEFTRRLIMEGATGTYHMANMGDCTWYEFAEAVVDFAGHPCDLRPIPTSEFPRPAPRPPFSVLDLSAATALVGHPRHWRDALAECLEIILHETALDVEVSPRPRSRERLETMTNKA